MLFLNQDKKMMALMTYFFENNNRWLYYSQVESTQDLSRKTVLSYIRDLKKIFAPWVHFSHSGSMVKASFKDSFGLVFMNRIFLSSSLISKVLMTSFFNPTISKVDLALDLFSSTSTIYRNIQLFNEELKTFYDLHFSYSDLSFKGKEDEILRFYCDFFFEVPTTPYLWPFEGYVDEGIVDLFVTRLVELFDKPLSNVHIRLVKIYLAVSMYRLSLGERPSTKKYEPDVVQLAAELLKDDRLSSLLMTFFKSKNITPIVYDLLAYLYTNLNYPFLKKSLPADELKLQEAFYRFFSEKFLSLVQAHHLNMKNERIFFSRLFDSLIFQCDTLKSRNFLSTITKTCFLT